MLSSLGNHGSTVAKAAVVREAPETSAKITWASASDLDEDPVEGGVHLVPKGLRALLGRDAGAWLGGVAGARSGLGP